MSLWNFQPQPTAKVVRRTTFSFHYAPDNPSPGSQTVLAYQERSSGCRILRLLCDGNEEAHEP